MNIYIRWLALRGRQKALAPVEWGIQHHRYKVFIPIRAHKIHQQVLHRAIISAVYKEVVEVGLVYEGAYAALGSIYIGVGLA